VANNRVLEFQEHIRALERGGQAQSQNSGSFLGGLFGASRPASSSDGRPTSVPEIGARSTGYEDRPVPQASAPLAPASGGFMRSAMATTAGVAGGMLLAESVRRMMGGAHANPATATDKATHKQEPEYVEETETDADPMDDGGDFGGGDLEV